jgi:hypothetical protein
VTRAVFAAVLGAAAAGCGSSGVPVSGTVTVDGQPLSGGLVAFEPAAGSGTTGAGAVAGVREGRFEIPAEKNLLPGKYLVRVGPLPPASGEDLKTAPPQFKPWETTVEVAAGAAPFAFDVPGKK